MDPSEASAFMTAAIVTLMVAAWLISIIPPCNDPECSRAHTRHSVAARTVAIEKQHATYHDRLRPQPTCALCQAARRDDPET